MNSERIIAGSIILLIIIVVVSILKMVSFFKKRKIIGSLYKLAQKNNETLQQYDCWNTSAIGLGSTGKKIFLVNNSNREIKDKTIDLTVYKNCQVINDNSKALHKEGNFKVTDKIMLELTGKNNVPEYISFYNSENDGSILTDELQLAEKWCRLVNEQLSQTVTER